MTPTKSTKDLVTRAAWTFVQTFVSVFAVGVPLVVDALHTAGPNSGKVALVSLATGATAAAISAFKTFIKQSI